MLEIFGVIFIFMIALFSCFFIGVWISLPKRIPLSLKGKHVFITGGSKGIGKETALEVIRKGAATVSIAARNLEALESAAADIQTICKVGQNVKYYSMDAAGGYEKVKSVMDKAAEESGPINVLINNVGVVVQGAFDEIPVESFEKQMSMNYLSAAHSSRAVIENMKKNGSGHIAFVSSAAGQCAIWGYTSYSPSKFALRGFADSLHMELMPFNIGVSILYPPNTDTEGYVEELRTMPEEVRRISESAGLFSAQPVAQTIAKTIENGNFTSTIGIEGWMLGMLTNGAGPEPNFINAFAQCFLNGIFRGIMLIFLGSFYRIVKACHLRKKKSM
uniref:3-ketodihydrosphingosine reductase n=2 Tax=Panagrolaimus sp. PS1159 TaxID=55785 RepID=A0AC35EYJ7_9BILA